MRIVPRLAGLPFTLAIALALALPSGRPTALAAQPKGKKPPAAKKAGNKKAGAKKPSGKKPSGKKPSAGKQGGGKKVTGGPPGTSQSGPSIAKADKPTIDSWDIEDVEGKGRIAGSLKHCPGCNIEALDPLMTAVQRVSVRRGDPDFCIEWLDPGTYIVRVTGGGFSLIVPNVSVQAMSDTFIGVEFPAGSDKGGRARSAPPRVERWPTWRPPVEPAIPVTNFTPKSFRELEKMWKGANLTPTNRRKNSGRGRGKRHKGKARKKRKGR